MTKQARLSIAEVNRSGRLYKDAKHQLDYSRERLQKAVREARKQHSVVEIGQTLGMTRQGVYDLLKR